MASDELSFSKAIRAPAFFEKSPRKRLPTRSPNNSDSLIRVSSKKQVRLGEAESNSSSSGGEELEDGPKRDPANARTAPFSAPSLAPAPLLPLALPLALPLERHSAHIESNNADSKQPSALSPIIESPNPNTKADSCPANANQNASSSSSFSSLQQPHSGGTLIIPDANRIQIRVLDFEGEPAAWSEFIAQWKQQSQYSFLFIPAPGSTLTTNFASVAKDDEPSNDIETSSTCCINVSLIK